MQNYVSLFAVASTLLACDAASEPQKVSESLDVFATLPDGRLFGVGRRSFGVGVQSELRVAGDVGLARVIRSVSCPADECTVATAPSGRRTGGTLFLVTPRVSDFHVHIDFDPTRDDATSSLDRVIHAEDGELVAMHLGAGPGVPFVEGMHVVWYLGTRAPGVAWSPTGAKVTVTPPFQIVDPPQSGEGPDQDQWLRVAIAAPADLASETHGTLVVSDGATSASFAVAAVPRRSISKLLIAPIPSSAWLARAEEPPFVPQDRISVPSYGVAYAWLAFETKEGTRGIAGTGECLPAVNATYDLVPYKPPFYGFELDEKERSARDQPFLELQARSPGTSRLRLAFAELEGSVDVVVGGGQ